MFDTFFEALAWLLDVFYSAIPNYAVAIALLTIVANVVTTPLALKGTRSMVKMQLLQPELRRIQMQYKGDRQTLNEEMMKFYQEQGVNPVGGCIPLLVQAPVFILLFNLIRGLTRVGDDGTFDPQHLDAGSQLFRALDGATEMQAFGIDLSESTTSALTEGFVHGLPFVILILLMVGGQYLQQRQVTARNPDGQLAMPQQKILLRVMPVMFGFVSLNFPAALVVYSLTSSLYRIGLQAYITRSLYHGEDSLGAQATRAAAEARALAQEQKAGSPPAKGWRAVLAEASGGATPDPGAKRPAREARTANQAKGISGGGRAGGKATTGPKAGGPAGATAASRSASGSANGSGAPPRPHPSSKKKKRKRR